MAVAPEHSAPKPAQNGPRNAGVLGVKHSRIAGAVKEEEAVADLCDRLEAGFNGSDLAIEVLEPIISFIGAETASLRLKRNEHGRGRTLPLPIATVGIPDAVGDAYRERFHKLDPARWMPPCSAGGPVFADPDRPGQWLDARLSPAQTSRLRSDFFQYRRAFLEPYNLVQHVGFCFDDELGQTLLFDFHRGRDARSFGPLEIARTRVVARYLHARLASRWKAVDSSPHLGVLRPELSARELEVAAAVEKGLTNKEVAVALSISVRTVENHMRSIFAKLGVGSRTRLAAILHRTLRST